MSGEQPSLPSLVQLPHMVVWYGPTALYATGMRTIISGIFGQYADQRILQWATDQAPAKELAARYDYSKPEGDGPLWVDYVSDAGDGFDSAYAIASLVAAQSLDVADAGRLEGGKLLIMGGDQVYPYASPDQYEERFITPYSLADCEAKEADRKMFVLPGNHDWYDGLASFDQTFCQARDGVSEGLKIGRWHCPQHRSYFAIRLPHDWWIWGLDTQLTRNLDVGQIRYFDAVAKSMPDRSKAKIILCIPQPAWMDAAETGSEKSYPRNLNRIVPLAFDEAKVCAIVAGDTHHYSRYRGTDNGLNLITAGGGGAYLSPTHHLSDTIGVPWGGQLHEFSLRQSTQGQPGEEPRQTEPSLFPSRAASKALSWRLLLFPFHNRAFSFVGLGLFYWLLTWMWLITSVERNVNGGRSLLPVSNILRNLQGWPRIDDGIWLLLDAAINSPLLAGLALAAFAAFYSYVHSNRWWVRAIAAFLHWSAHIAVMTIIAVILIRLNIQLEALMQKYHLVERPGTVVSVFLYPLEIVLIGGFFGGVVWGIYLFVNCRIFRLHLDDAFSALSLRHYKHFLRMKIEPDRLTIYPIGLKHVPFRLGWRPRTAQEKANGVRSAFVPRRALKPHLIEGPIIIRPTDVRDF
jgi:hypothetical protein